MISAAALVIDPVNRCVWSRHPPNVVGQQSSQTEFSPNESNKGTVNALVSASSFPVEVVYAVPHNGRLATDPS